MRQGHTITALNWKGSDQRERHERSEALVARPEAERSVA